MSTRAGRRLLRPAQFVEPLHGQQSLLADAFGSLGRERRCERPAQRLHIDGVVEKDELLGEGDEGEHPYGWWLTWPRS